MWPFKKKKEKVEEPEAQHKEAPFLISRGSQAEDILQFTLAQANAARPSVRVSQDGSSIAMDACGAGLSPEYTGSGALPDEMLGFFASQTFIGHQLCAIIAQHWLVNKACWMPARDAVRNGFNIDIVGISENEDEEAKIVKEIEKLNKKFKLKQHLEEFGAMKNIFGVRVAIHEIRGAGQDYYLKPFNIDSIRPGSYLGMRQVDPYWCMPELDSDAVSYPESQRFYEPTYWRIGGTRYHHTHVIVGRAGQVPDLLKPLYQYGGIPVPQQIVERVYAAERTANEAPMLAMNKRNMIWNTDLNRIASNQSGFAVHMNRWMTYMSNYGVKLVDQADQVTVHDTSLAELDTVIMTAYQLVAAAARVPATKLLGTAPKGFNATGEYDEAAYHEELESQQENDYTPFVDHHHRLLMRSEILPKFGLPRDAEAVITWKPLDTQTAAEQAQTASVKSQFYATLANIGAIDGTDIRNAVRKDAAFGLSSIDAEIPEMEGPDLSELLGGVGTDEFKEADHPRDKTGQFTSGSGGGSTGSSEPSKETAPEKPKEKPEPNHVSQSHAAALKDYTGAGYRNINGHLRGGTPADEKTKANIKELDDLLNNASLEKNQVLYRGLGSLAVKQLLGDPPKARKGAVLQDAGFVSTSTNAGVARSFVNISPDKNIMMVITAPKGAKALDVSKYSDTPGESETLFARNSQFKVIKFDAKAKKLEVELLPPAKSQKQVSDVALDEKESKIEGKENDRFNAHTAAGMFWVKKGSENDEEQSDE